MPNIVMKFNHGFKWYSQNDIWVKGFIFDQADNYFEGQSLLDFILKKNRVKERFISFNGQFTLVFIEENIIHIVLDRTRSFPIFYTKFKSDWMISDAIHFLVQKTKAQLSEKGIGEMENFGFTLNNQTLYENIFQVKGGQQIKLLDTVQIHSFVKTYSISQTSKRTEDKLIWGFEKAFNRLRVSLKNHPIALPLSGGYDSRLIAVMLKKMGFKNVFCFTYGRKNHLEVAKSQKVAQKLGFSWRFIEYNEDLIQNFLVDPKFTAYIDEVGNGNTMPYLQEYFAIKYLKDNKIIPDNTIFIPGHSGDFLGGSQLDKIIDPKIKYHELVHHILDTKAVYKPNNHHKNNFVKSIEKSIGRYPNHIPYSIFEQWDVEEKLTKFTANSSKVFDHFGYQYRLPFWDTELVEIWKDVPLRSKQNKQLFNKILEHHYFKPFGVNFIDDKINLLKNNSKKTIKKIIGIKKVNKKTPIKDWMFYKEITNYMQDDLIKKGIDEQPIYSYNSILINWYINHLKST